MEKTVTVNNAAPWGENCIRLIYHMIGFSPAAGLDYVGISRNLDFAPGVTMQTIRVTILDDLGQPVLEGPEKFELVLRMPMNGIMGEPSKATIFINDSVSDCECMNAVLLRRNQSEILSISITLFS